MKSLTWFIWLFILVIVVGVGFWVINERLGTKQKNYIDIYELYSTPCLNYWTTDTTFKDTNSLAALAMRYYEKKNYQLAAEALQQFEPQLKDEGFYNLYMGICYLNINFDNLAINHLNFAMESFKDFSSIYLAKWFLGLAHLKLNQPDEASLYFEDIIKMNAQYRTQAKLILDEIEKRKSPFKRLFN